MSTGDQLLLARISGVCSRYCARGEIDDLDVAVAERRAIAGGDRPELLAEHAGVCLGMAEADTALVLRFRAEAELSRAAGADEPLIERWIEVGKLRAAQSRLARSTATNSKI